MASSPSPNPEITRVCIQCKKEKPVGEFRQRGGFKNPICTTCGNANRRAYNNMGRPTTNKRTFA